MNKKIIIGPGTGWLYSENIYCLQRQKEIIEKSGASAVEINFFGWYKDIENLKRMQSLKDGKPFNPAVFLHRSVHIPTFDGRDLGGEIKMVKQIFLFSDFDFVVTHPIKVGGSYPNELYRKIIENGFALAIENMDSKKDSGFDIEELKELLKTVSYFVLDVQHAYEHDPSMGYALDLFEAVKKQLVYLHVSGQTDNNCHALIHQATNRNEILSFLQKIFFEVQIPIILEGKYETSEDLRKEIRFLTKELS